VVDHLGMSRVNPLVMAGDRGRRVSTIVIGCLLMTTVCAPMAP
jgi:hypothetical protein